MDQVVTPFDFARRQLAKDEIRELPVYDVGGRKVRLVTGDDIGQVVADIRSHKVVGFDTESKPAFSKGGVPVLSLVQLVTHGSCYLFHLPSIAGAEGDLVSVIEDPGISKVGFGLKSDHKELRAVLGARQSGVIDLARVFNFLGRHHRQTVGAKQAVAILLGKKLTKSHSACTSDWSALPYSHSQIRYASEDAAAPLDCFQVLIERLRVDKGLLPETVLNLIGHHL